MAFNLEDVLPKGWIEETTFYPELGARVTTYRNPNADPVEREKHLKEVGKIMLPAYYRALEEGKIKNEVCEV